MGVFHGVGILIQLWYTIYRAAAACGPAAEAAHRGAQAACKTAMPPETDAAKRRDYG